MADADLQCAKQIRDLGGVAEERFGCKKLTYATVSFRKPLFGRMKPNCAVVSIAAEGAGQLSQLSNE
jgi:hypothetical protein